MESPAILRVSQRMLQLQRSIPMAENLARYEEKSLCKELQINDKSKESLKIRGEHTTIKVDEISLRV